MQSVYSLILFLASLLKRGCMTLETSTINSVLLSHQWSYVCSQGTMPGDRNSILCSHRVSFTFAWGYCRPVWPNYGPRAAYGPPKHSGKTFKSETCWKACGVTFVSLYDLYSWAQFCCKI